MTSALATALASYIRIRLFPYHFRNRITLVNWQQKKLARWLDRDVPRVPAFAHLAGQHVTLDQLPIMDKSILMADFSRYNLPAISNEQGWEAFAGDRQIGDHIVGASTGTSGNRGLFVISQAERFAWLGAMLAKAVPDFWRHRDRVAILLPIDTPLYDSANQTGRLKLKFFDISNPLSSLSAELQAFDPTLLVAPPRILRQLCTMDLSLRPRKIFSGAEKLEQADRAIIEARFGQPLGEIYMATEGLLAVSCSHGHLHLAEDCLHFDFEDAGNGLVSPILSDFNRSTQIMARYRLNDLLKLDPSPCSCGSPLMVISEIVGRKDDIFCFSHPGGQIVELTPDILRNVIVDSSRSIDDFRLLQTGPTLLELQLPAHLAEPIRQRARYALGTLLARFELDGVVQVALAPLQPHEKGKLRRVCCMWKPPTSH